jgi:hypothetical protein
MMEEEKIPFLPTTTINYEKLEAFRQTLPEYQRHETYRFFVSWWDVVKARYLAAEAKQEPRLTKIAPWVRFFGIDKISLDQDISVPVGMAEEEINMALSSVIHIDIAWAMSDDCNLDQPLIFVQIENGEKTTPLLIDGLHRLYKAHRLEEERLPYFMLTVEESNLVRILR